MGTASNKALIREYLARVESGDPRLAELLDDDVLWWIPAGSRLGGTLRGRAKVLEVMTGALALYSRDHPFRIEVEQVVAEEDWVCVQFVIDARTASGRDYRNSYHIAFELRDGRIVRVKEYIDTAYANERLMGS
jgi:ketosteroid isomerase-like protein